MTLITKIDERFMYDPAVIKYKSCFNFNEELTINDKQTIAIFYWKYDRVLNAKLRGQSDYEDLLKNFYLQIKDPANIPEGYVNWITMEEYEVNPWLTVTNTLTNHNDLDTVINKLDANLRNIGYNKVSLNSDVVTWRCVNLKAGVELRTPRFTTDYTSTTTMIETATSIFCEMSAEKRAILLECRLDKSTRVVPLGIASIAPEFEITILPGNETYEAKLISNNKQEITDYVERKTGIKILKFMEYDEPMRKLELYRLRIRAYPKP